MIELTETLFLQETKLKKFGVEDANFSTNAREIIKIFTRKTIINMRTIIESILRNEREYKAVKDLDYDILITNGPVDLFRTLSSTYDLIQKSKIKELHEEVLKMFKECILLYLIGIDTVIKRFDLLIDNEFLIGVCNNAIKIQNKIDEFTEEIAERKILSEKEVKSCLGIKEISTSLSLITETSISRLVFELSSCITKNFINQNFFNISMEAIVNSSFEVYNKFIEFMHFSTQGKYWVEVLKTIVYAYMKSLFMTSNKKIKNIEELRSKISNDSKYLSENFTVLGDNQIESSTKMLKHVQEFLNADIDMINFCCQNIRNEAGKSFSLSTAKALIALRVDWSKDERNEAIADCKVVIENTEAKFSGQRDEFMDQLEQDLMNKEDSEQKQLEEQKDLELEEVSTMSTRKDMLRRQTLNLDDFLIAEENKEEDDEKNSMDSSDVGSLNRAVTLVETSNIIKEGMMSKKSSNNWQERFFQVKNHRLYWYLNDTAREAVNSISLKDILKPAFAHKTCKFTLVCDNKVYKFECANDEERDSWIDAINTEIKNLNGEKTFENIFQLEPKKKVINYDMSQLPPCHTHKITMKNLVSETMKKETFFVSRYK